MLQVNIHLILYSFAVHASWNLSFHHTHQPYTRGQAPDHLFIHLFVCLCVEVVFVGR